MTSRHTGARSILIACVATVLVIAGQRTLASAQASTAAIGGTVADESGAVVPGADVSVLNLGTRSLRKTKTGGDGAFIVPVLPPGKYSVTAQRAGFAAVEVQDLTLHVGDQLLLQLTLKVSPVGQAVTVTSDVSGTNTSPAVATTIDRRIIENAPLNGRTLQNLIALTPGVVLTASGGQFSVNGQRANANYFMVDGVSANIGAGSSNTQPGQAGAGSVPGFAVTGGTNNLVSIDALEEFKIQTSTYAPEFGRSPGAQVSTVTRSGTNQLRGTAFEYLRNEALDATDWFSNSRGLRKAALRQHDFGGVLGGPLLRNRTFFFVSSENLVLKLPQTQIAQTPTLALRESAAASVRPLLDAFPPPNGRDFGNGFGELAVSYSDPSRLHSTGIRLDDRTMPGLTIFGRYNESPSYSRQRLFSLNNIRTSRTDTRTLTVGGTYTLNANVVNDLRANYSRVETSTFNEMDDFAGGRPSDDALLFPSFTGPEAAQIGVLLPSQRYFVGSSSLNIQRQLNVVNNLTMIAGAHQLKVGVDYRRLSPYFGAQYIQFIQFATANAVGVSPTSYSIIGVDPVGIRFHNVSTYAQDSWRMARRLTLTYGVRWEVNPPPTATDGKQLYTFLGIEDPSSLRLAPAGTPLYETTWNNVAPRIGAAVVLGERLGRETVVRGGYGLFHDLGTGTSADVARRFPYYRAVTVPAQPFPLDAARAAPPAFTLNPPYNAAGSFIGSVFDGNLQMPYTHQWNISLEQSLTRHDSITATYVGASGRQLLRAESLIPPNPAFGRTLVVRNAAASDYRALQLQYRRRLFHGLQAQASYTLSRATDDASDDLQFLTNSARLPPNRGYADFDVRHAMSGAVTYDLPSPATGIGRQLLGNWGVDAIVFARSSRPVNVVISANLGFDTTIMRPDVVPGQPTWLDEPTAPGGRRLNPDAFTFQGERRQGTLARNTIRGFPAWQVDLALRREFRVAGRSRVQLRAEAFNLLNHPNFADPAASIGTVNSALVFSRNAAFGRSTTMLGRSLGGLNPLYQIGGPRSMQLGLKVRF